MPVEQLDHMTWEDVGAAVDRGAAIAVAITSTEQHGPHLPLGTDAMLGQALVLAAAEGLDLVVAPPIVYGYRSRPLSGGGQRFPGTTSLRAVTLIGVVTDVLQEFIRHGFRTIALVSHHMENAHLIYEAAYEVVGPEPGAGVKVMVIENPYPPVFSPATQQAIYPDAPPLTEPPGLGLDHASVQETSLMMHLRPELVRTDRIVDDQPDHVPGYDLLPIPDGFTAASGCLSGATAASAAKGAAVWPEVVAHLHGLLARELAA